MNYCKDCRYLLDTRWGTSCISPKRPVMDDPVWGVTLLSADIRFMRKICRGYWFKEPQTFFERICELFG